MAVNILDQIVAETRKELKRRIDAEPLEVLKKRALAQALPRPFTPRLKASETDGFRIIAELKKASPSKGLIRADFDPVKIAQSYEKGGCAAISVLTDEPFFQGRLEYLERVRTSVQVPLLRKDFIVDSYQVWEARAAGADAILLIVAVLDDNTLGSLFKLAKELGMEALLEVHDRAEIERAGRLQPTLVGVNNRNLRTFEVSLDPTRELLNLRPPGSVLVSESGFSSSEELERLRGWGVDAFLIGESLMRAEDPGEALAQLVAGGSSTPGT